MSYHDPACRSLKMAESEKVREDDAEVKHWNTFVTPGILRNGKMESSWYLFYSTKGDFLSFDSVSLSLRVCLIYIFVILSLEQRRTNTGGNMKAALSQYKRDKNQYVVLKDIPIPELQKNEVFINVQAASLNYADLLAVKGEYHAVEGRHFIPGFDCAGIVTDIGADVDNIRVGDRVAGFPSGGALAEYAGVHKDLVYPIPEGISYALAAASLSIGITAYELVYKIADIQKGQTALIHAAASSVGLILIQLLKREGATVIGTAGSTDKIKIMQEHEVDHAVFYKKKDVEAEVLKVTHNTGADVIFDSIGGAVFEQSIKCAAPFGKVITYGHASGKPGQVCSTDLHPVSKSIIGYSSGQRQKECPRSLYGSAEKIMELLQKEELRVLIGKELSLSAADKGFQLLEDRNRIGKIIISFE